MDLEGLQREGVVRGHKNDGRHGPVLDLFKDAEAIEFGHLDIEEEQIGLFFGNGLNGSCAIIAFADEFYVRFFNEQSADALASQRFIIDY